MAMRHVGTQELKVGEQQQQAKGKRRRDEEEEESEGGEEGEEQEEEAVKGVQKQLQKQAKKQKGEGVQGRHGAGGQGWSCHAAEKSSECSFVVWERSLIHKVACLPDCRTASATVGRMFFWQ